jgi:putative hydrolase of the HAD superfamily
VSRPAVPCVALDFGGTIARPGPSPRGTDVSAVLRDRFGVLTPQGFAGAVDAVAAEARAAYKADGRQARWEAVVATAADRVGIQVPVPHAVAAAVWDVVPDAVIDPSAADAVRRLHAAGRVLILACNTQRPADSRQRTLRKAGLAGCFAALVLSSELGVAKPDPRFYAAVLRAAAEHAGCGPRDVVFAGDTPDKDITGPLRAGMRAALVCPGNEPGWLPAGVPVIGHLAELPALLEAWP